MQRPGGPDIIVSHDSCAALKDHFLNNGLWLVTIPPLSIRKDFSASKSRIRKCNESKDYRGVKPPRKRRRRAKLRHERHPQRNGAVDVLSPTSKEKTSLNRNPFRPFVVRGRESLPGDNHRGPTSYFVVQSKSCSTDSVLLLTWVLTLSTLSS